MLRCVVWCVVRAVCGVVWCVVRAVCGVVCGACRVWCGVVCGVESTPIIVLPKSCVNTYEGCFERPAVLKKEDIPNIRQTAIHP